MPIFDLYSKRKRRAEQGAPGPYQYDVIPPELRRQIVIIWLDTIGPFAPADHYSFHGERPSNDRWRFIFKTMLKERGVFELGNRQSDPCEQCQEFLLNADTDDALDIIEVSFRLIERVLGDLSPYQRREESLSQEPDDAIAELNARFREHRLGYQYVNGQIVRVDSELLYNEVTIPALVLLHEEGFEGPLDEFMNAHEHYRKGEAKDANVDALNALESTLKAICDARKWRYPAGANGAGLVKIVIQHGLIPPELQSHFDHLIEAMKTGLPPVRHNYGGHGQGAERKSVPDHLAGYALHLMAANIVLLIEAHKAFR